MKKKISLISPMTICILIFAIPSFYLFYKSYTPTINDPVGGKYIIAIFAGISGGIIGLIIWFIGHMMFRPNHTQRLLQEQNRMLHDNNANGNNSKIDELKDLDGLKKSGAITEDEFNRLKNEILNRM